MFKQHWPPPTFACKCDVHRIFDSIIYDYLVFADLEADLKGLRRWLHEVESQVLPLHVRPNWTVDELEVKLKEHQVNRPV